MQLVALAPVLAALVAPGMCAAVQTPMALTAPAKNFTFQTITGYFSWDDPSVDPTTLPAIAPNFGLLDNTTWAQLEKDIKHLNAGSKDGSQYKLVYAARHGEGYHNVAEAKYGTPAWDSYWSKLNGDGNLTWGPDAQLTPTGIAQAQAVHDAWVSQLSAHRSGKDSAPLPSKLYSSPLSRSANTLNHTFAGIILAETPKEALGSIAKGQLPGLEHPLVKELFREQYGVHTCDKRSNKAVLHERFPTYFFEKGFTEEDEIWTADVRETDDQTTERVHTALSQVWSDAAHHEIISITSHSGVMQALFRATGHRVFGPKTGSMIPILLKGTPQKA